MSHDRNEPPDERNRRFRQEERQEEEGKYRSVTVKNLIFLHQTAAAILVKEDEEAGGSDLKYWLPKSQLRSIKSVFGTSTGLQREGNVLDIIEKGNSLEVTIPKWLADEKECIYE